MFIESRWFLIFFKAGNSQLERVQANFILSLRIPSYLDSLPQVLNVYANIFAIYFIISGLSTVHPYSTPYVHMYRDSVKIQGVSEKWDIPIFLLHLCCVRL